jgi:hypothetical protein
MGSLQLFWANRIGSIRFVRTAAVDQPTRIRQWDITKSSDTAMHLAARDQGGLRCSRSELEAEAFLFQWDKLKVSAQSRVRDPLPDELRNSFSRNSIPGANLLTRPDVPPIN